MKQAALQQGIEAMEAFLTWSETHQGATLRELEERAAQTLQTIKELLMEAGIAQQGIGERPSQPCACGGAWVFKGYKEREVMTQHGRVRIRRAYYVCDRCGAGIFPPG